MLEIFARLLVNVDCEFIGSDILYYMVYGMVWKIESFASSRKIKLFWDRILPLPEVLKCICIHSSTNQTTIYKKKKKSLPDRRIEAPIFRKAKSRLYFCHPCRQISSRATMVHARGNIAVCKTTWLFENSLLDERSNANRTTRINAEASSGFMLASGLIPPHPLFLSLRLTIT